MTDPGATGYDLGFLTVELPMPTPASAPATQTLPFTHFTVVLDPSRRLAVLTAVNLDGSQLQEVERDDEWYLDERVPPTQQAGPEIYADNDLDRGHLVRRRDPVWGDLSTATQANTDTFSYVNAAPQAALFNQGELLWVGLEDYLLGQARTYAQRLSVFTAPVFGASDVPYRGIEIPRRFFKIAAWRSDAGDERDGTLAATGYVLDQSPQLDLIDLSGTPGARATPPLGAYLTYQVPIMDIATLTGLDLALLITADRLPVPTPLGQMDAADLAPGSPVLDQRWLRLNSVSDLRF